MNKLLATIMTQVGVQEDAAHTNHGEAVKYQIAAGLPKGGGFPWCQSLVFWCGLMAYAEYNTVPKTGGVLECLRQARINPVIKVINKEDATISNIPPGAQFILKFDEEKGHTGIVVEMNADGTFKTIEGNSNHLGGRDGYEVCYHSRSLSEKSLVAFIIYPDLHNENEAA